MFFTRLIRALDGQKIPYAIAGGWAVALHGAVRGTIDIDLVITHRRKDFIKFATTLQALGLESRLPVTAEEVFDFREEYIKNKNLIAWTFVNPDLPSEIVDVILTHDLKNHKTESIKFKNLNLKILALGDLIKMKSKTGRKQDQEDIRALKKIKERQ